MRNMKRRKEKHLCFSILMLMWMAACLLRRACSTPSPSMNYTNYSHSLADTVTAATIDITVKKPTLCLCSSISFLSSVKPKSEPRNNSVLNIFFMLMLSGDIQQNPGPGLGSIYPCGYCEIAVNWSHRALCCDTCDIWYHKSCLGLCTEAFKHLEDHNELSYVCNKCDHMNYATGLYHSYELELSNYFEPLSSIQSPNDSRRIHSLSDTQGSNTFAPRSHSSPKVHSPRSPASQRTTGDTTNPTLPKSNNFRTVVMNCNSVTGKVAALANLINYTDPDVIMMCETKIDSSVATSEFIDTKLGYVTYRKDRKMGGGGVLIAIKDTFPSTNVEIIDVNGEIVWAEITIKGKRKLYMASFYRPPDESAANLDVLEKALRQIAERTRNNPNSVITIGGDFNCGDINWDTVTVNQNSSKKPLHEKLIEIIGDHSLTQLQRDPTRENRVLDLFLTSKPGLSKSMSTIPGISDHHIIVADMDINPIRNFKPPRTLYQYKKADWTKMREETRTFSTSFIENLNAANVQHNWNKLKSHLTSMMNKYIPTKKSRSRNTIPWFTNTIKRLVNRKQRLYNKARKSNIVADWDQYKSVQKNVQKSLRHARWEYINNILLDSLKEHDSKPFWKYIKSQKQDSVGVAPLKENGTLQSTSKEKARILNNQFKSVFTSEDKTNIPTLSGPSTPTIRDLHVNSPGVAKLLARLQPKKASGPDNLPCRLLKELSNEIAPMLTALFNQSLSSGEIPEDWSHAFVAPIFKKGNHNVAENYRPVSLTSVCCKILEHIICRHVLDHLDFHKILTCFQHGFRSAHSCETQLLLTLDDLMKARDKNIQVDVAVLDFSKAFDTVPHERLLGKLTHYGIQGNIHSWIRAFLTTRQQSVVVDGAQSEWASVKSGVPQGTVLGPLLFLLHINDLPNHVTSSVRLFADDCLVYRQINNTEDQAQLQRDLDNLVTWADTWGMRFNAKKCNIIRVCKSPSPLTKFYTMCGQVLVQVQEAKYLGLTISEDLSWSRHIGIVVNRANSTIGFLRRNLRSCPEQLKSTAYIALVRSTLEYCSPIWDPYLKKDITAVEKVQRRAARFVKHKYRWDAGSVSDMISDLGWASLEDRRKMARMTLVYKIVNGLVAVPVDTSLTPADSRTRAAHSKKFKLIATKTQQYKHSFYPRSIPEWNNLPATAVSATSTDALKTILAGSLSY